LDYIRRQCPEVADAIEGYDDAIRPEVEAYAEWSEDIRQFVVEDMGWAEAEPDGSEKRPATT
jgi:hypothetical protein